MLLPETSSSPDTSFVRAPSWLALGVPFLAITLLVWIEVGGLNAPVFYWVNGWSRITGKGFWAHVTILGDGLVCAVLLLPWVRRHPERVWGGLLGALAMFLVLRFFKGVWNLPRPLAVLPEGSVELIGPGHRRSAFPSGHTATVFLLSGIWALSTPRWALSGVLVGFAALVGASRIVVGVHWPSDVLAGAALGWTTAWLGLRWAGRWAWGLRTTGQLTFGVLLLVSALVLLLLDHTGYPGVLLFQKGLATLCILVGSRELIRLKRTRTPSGNSDSKSRD